MKSILKTVKILLVVLFIGCSDEHLCEIENEPQPCRAECGVVTAKKIVDPNEDNTIKKKSSDLQYTIKITNECTGNSKKFIIPADVWTRTNVGETLCADNLGIW